MVSDSSLIRGKTPKALSYYNNSIAMSFLREGTIAKVVSDKFGTMLVIADMDGEALFAERMGHSPSERRPLPERYINVCFLHTLDQYRIQPGQRPGADSKNSVIGHVNDTLYLKDGWDFYVDAAAARQYRSDTERINAAIEAERQNARTAAVKTTQRNQITKQIEDAEKILRQAREDLAKLGE